MAELKPEFYEGCRASGTSPHVIEQLWTINEKSADYSFNRSHAACYALIAYRTAWLKANFPAEYMAALISSVMSTKDKVPFFVARCEEMGIEILPPDVNLSDHEFMVVEGNIRFGLDAVKGVGYAAVEAMKRAREEGGPFTSLWDFCERVDCRTVNKKAIEALIKCGAFGSTGATRRGMLEVLEAAQGAGSKAQLDAEIGQGSIFDLGPADGGASPFAAPAHPPIPTHEFERTELLAVEKESIGLFISDHPLKRVREALRAKADCGCAEVMERKDQDWITIGGMITAAKKIRSRAGAQLMFATLDDLEGSVELMVFEKTLAAAEAALQLDQIVLVKGVVDHKEGGKTCLIVREAQGFDPSDAEIEKAREQAVKAAEPPKPLHLVVDAERLPASVIERPQADLRGLPRRVRGRARGAHERRPAAAEVRPGLPRGAQRVAEGRARPPARTGAPARPRLESRHDAADDEVPAHRGRDPDALGQPDAGPPRRAAAAAEPEDERARRARRPHADLPDGPDRSRRSRPSPRSRSPTRCARSTSCGARRRCTARAASSASSIRRRTSTTSTRASRRPARTSPTPRSRRPTTTREDGVRKLSTETGAGQWGSALAFACRLMDWSARCSWSARATTRSPTGAR